MTDFLSQFHLAESLREKERYTDALDAYCKLLRARLTQCGRGAAPFHAVDVVIMERVADLALFHDRPGSAAEILDVSRSILAEAGNTYSADWASIKAASAHLAAGNWSQARSALLFVTSRTGAIGEIGFTRKDVAGWETKCGWPGVPEEERQALIARILLEAGKQAAAWGRYRTALVALELAYQKSTAYEEPLLRDCRAPIAIELAAARLERGDLTGSEEILSQFWKDSRPEAANVVSAREIEGRLALLRGDLGRALGAFEETRRQCVRLGLWQPAGRAALNLAYALVLVNQTARATEIAQQLLAEAGLHDDRGLSESARVLLELVHSRGRSLADSVAIAPSISELWLGGSRKSLASTRSEIPIFDSRASRSFLDLFELRSLTFFWLVARQEWTAARSYLTDLDRVFGETDSMLITCRRLVLDGILSYYENRLSHSEQLLCEAAQAAKELGLVHDHWQILRVLGWISERSQDIARTDDARAAAAELLRRMSLSLDDIQRPIFLLNKWTEEEERLAREIDGLTHLEKQRLSARLFGKWSVQIALLRKTVELMNRVDEYRRVVVRRSVDSSATGIRVERTDPWWKIVLAYWRKTALVRFLVLPDRVVIVTLYRARSRVGVNSATRLEIRQTVAAIHNALRQGDRTDIFYREMGRLNEILQWEAAVGALARSAERLLILADDSLHGAPFAALPCGGKLTGQEWNLIVGFETRRMRDKESTGLAFSMAVRFGDRDFPPLNGGLAETHHFNEWCSDHGLSVDKLGDDANASEVTRQLSKASYAHVVCHGMFRPDCPGDSGLVLINTRGEREILSIRTLSSTDLSRMHLGVFTSCWSADSFVLPGRFVISLPEICWRAGAMSVLTCLWEVSDEVTLPLMAAFYRYLNGSCPDEALRLAQSDCRSNVLPGCPLPDTSDPFFWAGFQVYGTPKKAPTRLSRISRAATRVD